MDVHERVAIVEEKVEGVIDNIDREVLSQHEWVGAIQVCDRKACLENHSVRPGQPLTFFCQCETRIEGSGRREGEMGKHRLEGEDIYKLEHTLPPRLPCKVFT